jgi:hypothetical protein
LEYHAPEERKAEPPQHRRGLADGQIPVHNQINVPKGRPFGNSLT